MEKPLDELYFVWLYSQVGVVDSPDPSASYWKLMKLLYVKEFAWIVPNDDNRAEDGRDLRLEFLAQGHISRRQVELEDPHWMRYGCSVLELLIAFSRRLSFEGDGHPRTWFWQLMQNIGLENHRDSKRWRNTEVDIVLDRIIWRTYEPNGRGGLFPMREPNEDQRGVELWYQMCSYLLERD